MFIRRRVPAWLFWLITILLILIWLYFMAWFVLKVFGDVDIGADPLQAIPKLLEATNGKP